ncbi:cilia- and flagella-associated protein 47-like [Amia ocellicauda]|uniref:cilia- and flagella-associated protein 47-like n=1 Tax=Amia ocellicauda TaxID=2972642 RepID=UPI003464AD9F
MRSVVWSHCVRKGDLPSARWIVNFDLDLVDGLVLAAVLAAYCPFLISTHFQRMYTNAVSLEQCLHNSLILANAFQALSLDIDVQATEISDPNPILMLMLCVYLYERLPQYLPKKTVHFIGSLHDTVVKQVRLRNPSVKPLVYQATIVGRESAHFSLPKGDTVTVPPKGQADVTVLFNSSFLRPMEAMLLLTSRSTSGALGATLTFSLRSQVNNIVPRGTIKCRSPCYELKKITLKVTNPFSKDVEFRVILVESRSNLLKQANQDGEQNPDCKYSQLKFRSDSGKYNTSEDTTTDQGSPLDNDKTINLNEFYSPVETLLLKARGYDHLEIHYLPFHLGKRYCTVLLVNDQVGELVYSVGGTAGLPLPSLLGARPSPYVVCISSVAPGHRPDTPVLCFKCSARSSLEEVLHVPVVNVSWERALATVAQQQMSSVEFERRKMTGTLDSSSVRAAVAARGTQAQPLKSTVQNKAVEYTVEVSMPAHFHIPEKIFLPISRENRVNFHLRAQQALLSDCDTVSIPLQFHPKMPGRYLCQVVIRSPRDVRVHLVECVVHGEDTDGDLEFVAPAHQSVTQDIPLSNETAQDWKLRGIVEGQGFHGPAVLYVRAGERVGYPLMFRPISECVTMGKLTLRNETDGTEHMFGLRGVGRRPLAVDHVIIDCQVRQIMQKVLMVPNYTQTRLMCKVVSDLSIVSGPPVLDIKPGHTAPYTINISPWKRGTHTGVISFVADDGKQQQPQNSDTGEEADGEQVLQLSRGAACTPADSTAAGENSKPYEVWFSLEVVCSPTQPVRVMTVQCAVQNTVSLEFPMSNPTKKNLHVDVSLMGRDLSGDKELVIRPEECFMYQAKFSPTLVGRKTASVIFQSDAVGEFWYELELIAEEPSPTTIPACKCELGKWTREFIPLDNPTDETLELETVNHNPRNFYVEVDPKRPLLVAPHSSTRVLVQFRPSALGKANHTTCITFKCPQLNEWKFYLSGAGLFPEPMAPLSMSTRVGTHSSVIVPFRNPTDDSVLVDVLLTDQEQTICQLSHFVPRHPSVTEESAFRFTLKQTQGILLTPNAKLDIPLMFTPDSMKLYKAWVVVFMVKRDGGSWNVDLEDHIATDLRSVCAVAEDGSIQRIHWVYPIHGIPEAVPSKTTPAVIRCQARSRIEERLEVLLTGCVPGLPSSSMTREQSEASGLQSEVQVTEGPATADEFLYEIQFESDDARAQLGPSVALCLLGRERDVQSGIVTLIFNIIFAPYKPLRCSAILAVKCATGGVWKFPITLISTEPEVDDVINIEAAGLNKVSMVGFRLTSQTRYPEPFTAYFLPGSGQEFEVLPHSGELLPVGSAGTLITVSFTPGMYSKKHRAMLVIQTADMQWTYEIRGVQQRYTPPSSQSSRALSSGPVNAVTVRQRNFVRENLQLPATAVSSPIKGQPLVVRTK